MREIAPLRSWHKCVRVVLFALPLATTACGNTCILAPFVRISATEYNLVVGRSATILVEQQRACSAQYEPMSTVWFTNDTTVFHVDSLSGRITGRAVGDAIVQARTAPAHYEYDRLAALL